MIELPILDDDFDEEGQGFGTPEPPTDSHRATPLEYAAVAVMALGFIVFLLSALGGVGRGGWGALLVSMGSMSAGTVAFWWARYRGTTPGIKHDDTTFRGIQRRAPLAWGLGVFLTAFYVVLYWYADLQRAGMAPVLDGGIALFDPLARALTGSDADQWFLYGFFYTVLILVMGVRMLLKYRHHRYQQIRTLSVAFFQLGFAFILPGVLKRLHQPDFYFTYFWPLKPAYAWPNDSGWIIDRGGTLGVFMIGFGVFMILVATPILTYFFGKRWYCSWVCGCGGLAETLGDPWRQLSSRSNRAWRIERVLIHSVLVLVVAVTILLWLNHALENSILGSASTWASKWYGFLVVNMFAGVVGVGFYPLMGSRVWCRFGCPMAAILGLLQRYFSRFRITTNGSQCMSCGNCSSFCEMGIDVRAYAQRGENIVRASCVGCGVCAAVCPRGVLKLENGAWRGRYAETGGGPLDQALADLKAGADPHR